MKHIWQVLRYELVYIFTRRSFLFVTFGIPLVGFLLFTAFTQVSESSGETLNLLVTSPTSPLPEGFVDPANLVSVLPASVPEGQLLRYPDEASARQALHAGEIATVYLVPPDLIEGGRLTAISPEVNPASSFGGGWMQWTLEVNLVGGDEDLAARLNQPLAVERISLTPDAPDTEDPLTFWIPYGLTVLLYLFIVTSASLLLGSLGREKSNRTLEVLLLSIPPRQLLIGKMAGLGLASLAQTGMYLTISSVLLRLSGRTSPVMAGFELPLGLVGWTVMFFVLGYLLYGGLMAAVGALVPNLRDASSLTFVILSPLILGLVLLSLVLDKPMSGLAVSLSLFPFTAPILMVTRLAIGGIPLWQPVVAAIGMLITGVLVVLATARLFRAQHLLTGQPLTLARFARTLLTGG